jgi:urease accessory protein
LPPAPHSRTKKIHDFSGHDAIHDLFRAGLEKFSWVSDPDPPDLEARFIMHRAQAALGLAVASAFAVASPGVAFAHPGIGQAHDLVHGFVHPFTGLDHLLAMLAVGVFAAQLGGRAVWLVPATFIAVMAGAAVAGLAGLAIPQVETGIALSVLVLGAAVAFAVRVPVALAMLITGFFAIFHGYAHGAEAPATAGGLLFVLGCVLASSLLNALGIGLGVLIGRSTGGRQIAQLAGGTAAVVGAFLLVTG